MGAAPGAWMGAAPGAWMGAVPGAWTGAAAGAAPRLDRLRAARWGAGCCAGRGLGLWVAVYSVPGGLPSAVRLAISAETASPGDLLAISAETASYVRVS